MFETSKALMASCRAWDLKDGDAQLLEGMPETDAAADLHAKGDFAVPADGPSSRFQGRGPARGSKLDSQ